MNIDIIEAPIRFHLHGISDVVENEKFGEVRMRLMNEMWQVVKTAQVPTTGKRRKGFPSETQVKRGERIVHGNNELMEKVGRNDPCPCGSGKLFKKCCRNSGCF